MKIFFWLFLLSLSLTIISCGDGDKKQEGDKKETKTSAAINFNAEVDAAPGTVISELSFIEKDGEKETAGKRITKFFEDTAKVVITVYKKANDAVYDAMMYTILKADAKGLKADLSPMNDGGNNFTTYTPKDFGAVSIVFVAEGTGDNKIVSKKNMIIFMDERKEETTKENGLNMPVADFKTADEWVKKLAIIFKK